MLSYSYSSFIHRNSNAINAVQVVWKAKKVWCGWTWKISRIYVATKNNICIKINWTEQGLFSFLLKIYNTFISIFVVHLKLDCHPPKKINFICFNESPLKLVKNAFCSILKALFILKTFNVLSWLIGYVEKRAWLEI